MSKINIDKTKENDLSYRYKMSKVILKDEGSGNGLRTVFVNLESIANDIKRDTVAIITYLASALGCKYISDKNDENNTKWILYGKYTKDTIQSHIYDFTNHFVICKHCKNPETKFHVEKQNVVLTCAACSKSSNISDNKYTIKVTKYIVNNFCD